jgi:predicted AAA+ superfamily ATPase
MHPVTGMSWEGFVIETLLSGLPWRANPFFYRTARGAEIDLLIEFSDLSLWAIEIKRSLDPSITRGFHEARSDLKPTRSFVVHSGNDRFPLGQGIEAIGLVELANELQSFSVG